MSAPNRFSRRAQPPAVSAVNQATGEVITIGDVNDKLVRLGDELERSQPELERLLREHQAVSLAYELRFAAAVHASDQRSEDRRKAEATVMLGRDQLPDSSVDIATRKSVLEMQIKAMRESQHNIRSQISGLQSLSANLRAEISLGGIRP